MIEKYSAEEKLSAILPSAGAKPISRMMATQPPKKEVIVVMKSATPARPCLAIG